MQTLKTAAIVVLMMTVMYSAYVSLTTPPEPLPEAVQGLLEFDAKDSLAFDEGLPESLGELEISGGEAVAAPSDAAPNTGDPNSGPSLGATAFGSPVPGATASAEQVNAPTDSDAPGSGGISTTFSDMAVATPEAGVPSPDASAPNYPSTGSTFDLPDPNAVASSFSGSNSAPVQTNEYALASGTSESNGMSPASAAIQTTELPPAAPAGNPGLANALNTADDQYMSDRRSEALATLSIFYNAPNLSGEQRSELVSRLDPLAREVIYSRRHLLEQPYRVGQNETLMEIAARYEVPWQLLANINQIKDPVTVLPGTELKVVRGPFRAEVNLTQKELTLFLGDLYAGRFPIGVGSDPIPNEGTYTIQDKQTSKTFYDRAGSPIPPGSAGNPYGNAWIDLGGQVCIHGSPSTTSPTDKGCISLAADYADDLYGILSQGSSVTIRR